MRVSMETCSGGSGTGGRSRARSSTELERGQQAEQINLELGLVVVADERLDPRVGPRPLRAAQRLAIVQQLRGGLELLVFEQPLHQHVARVFFGSSSSSSDRAAAAACGS